MGKIIVPRDFDYMRDESARVNFHNEIANRCRVLTSVGYIEPITSSDADAPNNTIYYSSDQSKLVYKDIGGTVNDLY